MAEAWVAFSALGGGAGKTYCLDLGNPRPPLHNLDTHICATHAPWGQAGGQKVWGCSGTHWQLTGFDESIML